MPKFIRDSKSALKHLFYNIIDGKSSRVQLVWATFSAWIFGIFYFATLVPIVRELSLIYYRQNSITAKAIDLDSPSYGTTILGMLGTAFMGTVVAYVASNWKTYAKQDPEFGIKNLEKITKAHDESEEP